MTHPLDLVLDAMTPLGATLEYGVVVSVDVTVERVTVHWRGADIPNVQYVGAPPATGDKVWMIRQAKSMVVLSPTAVAGGGGSTSRYIISATEPAAPKVGDVWINPGDDTAKAV